MATDTHEEQMDMLRKQAEALRKGEKKERPLEISYGDALREAISEEMARDPSIVFWGEGISDGLFPLTAGLKDLFGADRIMDTPICEPTITGSAIGAALGGLRPIATLMFNDFFYLSMGELRQAAIWGWVHNRAGGMKLPIVYQAQYGGYAHQGSDHSSPTLAFYKHIPGLKVVVPNNPYDAKGLMKTAIRDNNPVIYLMHMTMYISKGPVPLEEYTIPFGVASVLREGTDVTVVGIGAQCMFALQAAEELAKEGVSVEVIDPRTIEPLDMETIVKSVRKTGRVVVVDEEWPACSVASEIGMLIMEQAFFHLQAPVKRVCGLPVPTPGSATLEFAALPSATTIAQGIREVLAV